MKRVKRKEGKREWEAERVVDGLDCKIGSDAHMVCKLYCMNSERRAIRSQYQSKT